MAELPSAIKQMKNIVIHHKKFEKPRLALETLPVRNSQTGSCKLGYSKKKKGGGNRDL
ncbi:MAG: hypothetical protein KAS67_05540 [Thermoplasmata archaeon]|nr:hypothetical protein [Thermoplasmata archaeon]